MCLQMWVLCGLVTEALSFRQDYLLLTRSKQLRRKDLKLIFTLFLQTNIKLHLSCFVMLSKYNYFK